MFSAPLILMGKLKLREGKAIAQHHTASDTQDQLSHCPRLGPGLGAHLLPLNQEDKGRCQQKAAPEFLRNRGRTDSPSWVEAAQPEDGNTFPGRLPGKLFSLRCE